MALLPATTQQGKASTAWRWNPPRPCDRSLETPQVDFIARFQGGVTAVANWQRVVSAADEITAATGELLSLYGDLSGKNGAQKIFTDGAIDLDRLEQVAPRVDTVLDDLAQAEANLEAVQTGGRFTGPLDDVRNQALAEMAPVQTAVEVLVDIAPVLPQALGADGPRRYLIAIGNQAEMRASFGAPLTLLMVEFDDGRISIPIKGQTSTELFPPLNARVNWFGPAYNPFFLGNQRNRPFVVTNTHPNMLFSAQEMAGAWTGGNYPEVDGIIAMDLTAIAAVLEATGPIESPVYGTVTCGGHRSSSCSSTPTRSSVKTMRSPASKPTSNSSTNYSAESCPATIW